MGTYSFLDDYSEGCHQSILDLMQHSNMSQQAAYGNDEYSDNARKLIQVHLGDTASEVFFVAGGTLANLIIASSALRSHEAIITANSGHIVRHETGAIEAVGHKVISVPSDNGKLTVAGIDAAIGEHSLFPHMVQARIVYISNATERGTVYTKSELTDISAACKERKLMLWMDGARLGAALTSNKSDLTLQDCALLTDVFWIGGTKAGALIGEAIVISNPRLREDFQSFIKQRGALLAKGRLLGIQFSALFADDRFFDLTRFSNQMAQKLSAAIVQCGYELTAETESNQIFPALPNDLITVLQENFGFYVWQQRDNGTAVVRLVTSWATDEQQVDRFIAILQNHGV